MGRWTGRSLLGAAAEENMVLKTGKCGTAKNSACFVIGVKEERILPQQSVSLLLTCSISLSNVICLWQGITWDALLFPFDLLYILLCTPISFENKMLFKCLTGSFSFADLFL